MQKLQERSIAVAVANFGQIYSRRRLQDVTLYSLLPSRLMLLLLLLIENLVRRCTSICINIVCSGASQASSDDVKIV